MDIVPGMAGLLEEALKMFIRGDISPNQDLCPLAEFGISFERALASLEE
jgi:hypothetical protein